MPEISYSGQTVTIDNKKIEMEEAVNQVISVNDVILVHCEFGNMDPTNLVAFDQRGRKMWRISPLKKDEDDGARPAKGVDKTDQYVQVRDWGGDRYKLDLDTGDVEYLGWSR